MWEVDVEWLTTYVVSLMKSIDVRSEAAVGLLGEFLDLDRDGDGDGGRRVAEHFAHGECLIILHRKSSSTKQGLVFRSLLVLAVSISRSECVRHRRSGEPYILLYSFILLTEIRLSVRHA